MQIKILYMNSLHNCVLQFWELVEAQRQSPSSQTLVAVAWCPRQRAPLPQPRQAWWSAPTASPRGGNSSLSFSLCDPDSVSVCSLCHQSFEFRFFTEDNYKYALAFLTKFLYLCCLILKFYLLSLSAAFKLYFLTDAS